MDPITLYRPVSAAELELIVASLQDVATAGGRKVSQSHAFDSPLPGEDMDVRTARLDVEYWKEFPPRLPDQPIFYPVTNHAYATQIARDWNVKASGAWFVTRFAVNAAYLNRFEVQTVGGAMHTEYWIPAEELSEFKTNIVGVIEVIEQFGDTS